MYKGFMSLADVSRPVGLVMISDESAIVLLMYCSVVNCP